MGAQNSIGKGEKGAKNQVKTVAELWPEGGAQRKVLLCAGLRACHASRRDNMSDTTL